MAFAELPATDRIAAQAREVHPARVLLTIIAGVFYGLGWLAARSLAVVWLGVCWMAVAVKLGWIDGRSVAGQAGRR